jgi:hypothetical protein
MGCDKLPERRQRVLGPELAEARQVFSFQKWVRHGFPTIVKLRQDGIT